MFGHILSKKILFLMKTFQLFGLSPFQLSEENEENFMDKVWICYQCGLVLMSLGFVVAIYGFFSGVGMLKIYCIGLSLTYFVITLNGLCKRRQQIDLIGLLRNIDWQIDGHFTDRNLLKICENTGIYRCMTVNVLITVTYHLISLWDCFSDVQYVMLW